MQPARFDRITRLFAARSSRRGVLTGGAIAGAAVATSLPSLLRAAEATDVASPVASAVASPIASPAASTTFLFVQVATAATWAPKEGADGVYTLTLTHQNGQTVYFSDRPARITGVMPTDRFLKTLGFGPGDPPNAAIVAGDEIIVVELTNPTYDPATGNLTYDATPIDPGTASSGIQHLANRQSDQELPSELGPTSLFIDSGNMCGKLTMCRYYVIRPGPGCFGPAPGPFSCKAGSLPGGPVETHLDENTQECAPNDPSITYESLSASCNETYDDCTRVGGTQGCVPTTDNF